MSALSATRVGAVGVHWRPALKCQGQGRPVLISKATVTGRLLSASMFAGTPTFLIRRGAATMGSLMSAALRATTRLSRMHQNLIDRKSVVSGKMLQVRVDPGGR